MARKVRGGDRLLGGHCRRAGGPAAGPRMAVELGITAMQIFAKNNNQWLAKRELGEKEIAEYRESLAASTVKVAFSHAGYLINLAGDDPKNYKLSMESMLQELTRAEALGLSFVVLHPGAHKEKGIEFGVSRIADSIDELFGGTQGSSVKIALENTAGQ